MHDHVCCDSVYVRVRETSHFHALRELNYEYDDDVVLLQPMALMCEACGTDRQKKVANFKMWSCKFCTLENNVEIDRCLACGEWRYSYGPPVSIRGPHVGT